MQVPFSLVFTKTDKKKKRAPGPQENIAAFKRQLLQAWEVPEHRPPLPPSFTLSSSRHLLQAPYQKATEVLRPASPAATPH